MVAFYGLKTHGFLWGSVGERVLAGMVSGGVGKKQEKRGAVFWREALCIAQCFKGAAIEKFVLYKTEVDNQLGKKIKIVRSDREGEYVSPFVELCAKHGIRHEFTTPYSPQQNGIAEWKNHTLKEMVTAMLISSSMSQDMWGEAILTATYLVNKIPRKEKEETPYELWMRQKPSYHAYRFIVHDSKNPDIQKNTVMESRNASFFENIFPCLTKETESSSRLDDKFIQDKRQRDENDLQVERQDQVKEVIEPRRGKRARTKKSFGPNFVSFMVENKPTSYREAMKADGTIDKYKARLVIKGFRKREGLDYFDSYLPVMRITSVRMILAIAALRNLEVHQMDVKTVFLNGDLEEKIYMNQPEGFIAPGQKGKNQASVHDHDGHDYEDLTRAKMGSKLLNSCEPARPANTNAAPKARLCATLPHSV
nr:retrotransposon protein, putative, Ty1-copia subclass [Tanacetum cinerariifolium]